MQQHDFILNGLDTDSIMVSKPDGAPFSEEEQDRLIEELNSLFLEGIDWEDDGYYPTVIVLAAKNYVLKDESGKVTIKGSSLKDQKKEPALREFLESVIKILLENDNNIVSRDEKLRHAYHSYVHEIVNLKDIKRWASKKTISKAVLTNERANESKVRDAIVGSEYVEADKVFTFFRNDKSLCLVENFDGVDYDKAVLLKKLFKTSQTFKSVLDTKSLFINYALKKNQKRLELYVSQS